MRSRRRACGSSTAPRDPAQTLVGELGVRRPVRRAVVEQQHPLGQRHRPRRPGDNRSAARARANSRSTCTSTPTCPPATTSAAAAASRSRHGLPVPGDHRPLRGPPRPRRSRPLPRDPGEVSLVDEPDDGLGVGPRGVVHARSTAVRARPRADAPQHRVELHEVQLLQLVERGAVLALGGGVLRVALQHVQPAARTAARLTLRPSSSASSSASSGSRSCQPAVTIATGPAPSSAATADPAWADAADPDVTRRWTALTRRARAPCGRRRRACRAARRSRGGACARRRWPSTRPRPAASACPGGGRCASITHSPSRAWTSSTPGVAA